MVSLVTVDAPTPLPRKFGVFSVADVQDITDPHMLMGVQYVSDNCIDGSSTVYSDWCSKPTLANTVTSQSTVEDDDLALVWVAVQCAGINEFRDAQSRATKLLAAAEETQIEILIASKFNTTGAETTQASPPTLPNSLGIAEDLADGVYMGSLVFWMTRRMAEIGTANHVISQHGNRLETGVGSPVVASSYVNVGVGGDTTAAANQWVWSSARPLLRRGVMRVDGPFMVKTATNEVQTVSITGTPTGGTFTLTFNGQTTAAIAYNANAAAVQSALIALSNLATGDVVVTGTNPNFTVTFGGVWAGANPPALTATASLTGGTTPGVTIGTTTPGSTNEGDNTWVVIAQRPWVISLDCLQPKSIETTLAHP